MNKSVFMALLLALVPLVSYADHSSAPAAAPSVSMQSVSAYAVEEGCSVVSNLMLGSRNAEVACLQQHLIEDGLLQISAPTGYFGSLTKAAVIAWQKEKDLPETGFFGSLSRNTFGEHTAAAAAPAMHAHEPLNVSSWPAVPSVSIALYKDTMSGWNLEVSTQNFRFAPEHVNQAVVPNEGHTHIYIDGKKVSRSYGPWTHLPKEWFAGAGPHQVRVTLNANDHSELSLNGAIVEASSTVVVD